MSFTCPECGTTARYGLQTRSNGSRFWACNGSHRDPDTGRSLRSCTWCCEESQGIEFGLVTVRDAVLQVALVTSQVGTTLGVRALEQTPELRHQLADAAEELEQLGDKLRIVASYLLHQEQQRQRDAARQEAERAP